MSIESIHAKTEQEKKLRSEAEKKQEIVKEIEFKKEKKELLARLEKKKELEFLKSLIERGLLGIHAAEILVSSEWLETTEIEEIFGKIDEIEAVEAIDSILPQNLRITKDEYVRALSNPTERQAVLNKIDAALSYLYDQASPNWFSAVSIFFSGFMMLNKNLVLVQENTIDIKRSLANS